MKNLSFTIFFFILVSFPFHSLWTKEAKKEAKDKKKTFIEVLQKEEEIDPYYFNFDRIGTEVKGIKGKDSKSSVKKENFEAFKGIWESLFSTPKKFDKKWPMEDWYLYAGAGPAKPQYNDTLEEVSNSGGKRKSLAYELGFLFPLENTKTLLGVLGGLLQDRFTFADEFQNETFYQLSHYFLSATFFQYLSGQLKNGLFLRADIGVDKMIVTGDQQIGLTPEEEEALQSSSMGLSSAIGIGYSYKVFQDTRFLLQFVYRYKRSTFGDQEFQLKSTQFNIGFLF